MFDEVAFLLNKPDERADGCFVLRLFGCLDSPPDGLLSHHPIVRFRRGPNIENAGNGVAVERVRLRWGDGVEMLAGEVDTLSGDLGDHCNIAQRPPPLLLLTHPQHLRTTRPTRIGPRYQRR